MRWIVTAAFVATFFSIMAVGRGHENDGDAKVARAANRERAAGIRPTGANGKPLNLNFETGMLKDWTAEGKAFEGQPIKGDTPKTRDKTAQPQGDFWIGTFERFGDQPTGRLTSVAFKVTQPFATFMVGGGHHSETRVEIVRKDTGKVLFAASGKDVENLRRVGVDLREHQSKEIFIRLVDEHAGHWGHINFDDFRFHEEMPELPKEPPILLSDQYAHGGLTPEKAAEVMTVPEGFQVRLFAGEPDVYQPIAMAIDDRGRLWIAEAYEYPRRAPEGKGRDRIVIFEDADGDGRFDHRKLFTEGLNLVSGLEVGFGGVWVGAAPQFLFIPDKDGDDVPDGEPQVLLDGWGYQDTHETLNTFIWGPDGWLYGCHGVFTHSLVGKPGTPDEARTRLNAAIWRYHPARHEFDVFAHGTSNPWGVDFNDYGQAFATACVIPHLYHIIQRGRYQRQAGQHFNPYTYDDIKTMADHVHYLGANPHGGNNRSDSAGGGHAHAGAMIYLGGKWPERYRGQIFMNNIHGQRLNMDVLEPRGSGYVGRHGPDFLLTVDRWSQILNIRYGPDGDAYMIDWYDKNACHHNDVNGHDRSNGRIFKVIYGEPKRVKVDLKKLSDLELAELVEHENDWYVRHSRRLLQERSAERKIEPAAIEHLSKTLIEHQEPTRRLRALWALHVIGEEQGIPQPWDDANEYVRGWKVQTELQNALWEQDRPTRDRKLKDLAGLLAEMAADREQASPVVRLYLASAAQRMSVELRGELVRNLLTHSEDAGDHNLPLMYWYAAEPIADQDAGQAMELALAAKVPTILPFMVRKIASQGKPEAIAALVEALGRTETERQQLAIVGGLNEALKGQRNVSAPKSWAATFKKLGASKNKELITQLQTLAVTFGDPAALAALRTKVLDGKLDVAERERALDTLVKARDAKLPPILRQLLANRQLRGAALRGLAAFNDEETPPAILGAYAYLSPAEKRDAIATLSSRPAYARKLLDAMAAGKIPASDLSADLARQLKNLGDGDVTTRLAEVWGNVQDTSAGAAEEIKRYTALLTRKPNRQADLSHGRQVFAKTCQQCHMLFGEGGKVGPELTGSNRANLEYLLSNILDPSAVMAKEYQPSIITLADGRVVTGVIKSQDNNALVVQTSNELLTIPRSDVEDIQATTVSMMPQDLLKPLSDDDVRALVSYLASPKQVPLPASDDTAASVQQQSTKIRRSADKR